MKSFANVAAKVFAASCLLALCAVAAAAQERGRLRLESLDPLAQKASESVNVEIDGSLIKLGSDLLSGKDPEERKVKELAASLRGVYVRSYEFKEAGQFAEADLAQVRGQLAGAGWSRMVDLQTRGVEIEDAEVYIAREGARVEGLAILHVGPKELTVINIVGSVDLVRLRELKDTLGLPRIRIRVQRTDKRPTPKKP